MTYVLRKPSSVLVNIFHSISAFFFVISLSQSIELQNDPYEEARSHYRSKVDELKKNIENAGAYNVKEGRVVFYTLESCLELGSAYCFGNNPESPYGAYEIDPIDEQYVNDTDTITEFRFRPDEALVIIGATPPPATYFGFTHYLYRRFKKNGKWKLISGSIDDSINPMTINVTAGDGSYESKFDAETVIVYTGDNRSFRDVQDIVEEIGIPSSSTNLGVYSLDNINMGVTAGSDTVTFLIRCVNFYNKSIASLYMENPPLHVLRLTPVVRRDFESIEKYPIPIRSTSTTGRNEEYLIPTLNRLQRSIIQNEGGVGIDITRANSNTMEATLYGENCLANDQACYRDNSDSTYFFNYPGRSLYKDDFFIVFGPNHVESGFSRYISVSLYDGETAIAAKAFNSENELKRSAWRYLPDDPFQNQMYAIMIVEIARTDHFRYISVSLYDGGTASDAFNSENELKGSAWRYLPDDPFQNQMYAIMIRRDCTNRPFCMEVADLSKYTPAIVIRAYLSDSTVGPDPLELVGARVIFGTSKRQSVKQLRNRRKNPGDPDDIPDTFDNKPGNK
eukprot:CAMPEP_0194394618 /NCGR_PEP_ID=MMETSP0174-20130528/123953_1 /TAXON_ID=216777 /ORGANISM="Proboscia alata, Strain PI-D3" /LENGTH=563 /DNA_ID=CAMNT_0039190433 /DNA_START=57 /DNA_END=1749 /DNA_ORIENTATION=+